MTSIWKTMIIQPLTVSQRLWNSRIMSVPSSLRGEKWLYISKNDFEVQVEDSEVHYRVFSCHLLLQQSKWNVYISAHRASHRLYLFVPWVHVLAGLIVCLSCTIQNFSHWNTSKLPCMHWNIKDIEMIAYKCASTWPCEIGFRKTNFVQRLMWVRMKCHFMLKQGWNRHTSFIETKKKDSY